jgi:hypothetical protein
MSLFAPLLSELDVWASAGQTVAFWWRDDDASDATPALEPLLTVAAAVQVPLALAVVPMTATPALAAAIAGRANIAVWQHGIRHNNRARLPAKKQELTSADTQTQQDLRAGWSKLSLLFGSQAESVLVPPWNRIDSGLIPLLPELGFRGLSTFKPRALPNPAPRLAQVNAHVDLLDWRQGAAFRGTVACVHDIVGHVRAKRLGAADPLEPTGILSHHLAMQSDAWDFLSKLFVATKPHPACAWTNPKFSVAPEPT